MSSIMDLAKTEAMLFKYGSGAGVNLSPIRGSKEKMSGGGIASGPVSFMKGFDAFAGVVKSGGKTRRAAKMVILDADHPDVMEFIDSKANEERKAWALIEAGYDASFTGEAYGSVFFQNANHSVRVTDDFMHAVEQDGDWTTREVTTGEVVDTLPGADRLPQRWRRPPGSAATRASSTTRPSTTGTRARSADRIYASPTRARSTCSSTTRPATWPRMNLMKFVGEDGEFDVEAYRFASRVTITAQEILVDNASYPTPQIEENSHRFRPLGIGYANLGALLMSRGLAYDSDAGRAYAATLTAIMTGEAYRQSAVIARDHGGPFNDYAINEQPFLRVIGKHRDAAYAIPGRRRTAAAHRCGAADLGRGARAGSRSTATATRRCRVLAPTGTIAFMMDCDTTGIEPDIALVKYKKLVGEGFLKIVNNTVPAALRKLGYTPDEVEEIVRYINERETIEGAPGAQARAPDGVRLRLQAGQRRAVHPLHGPRPDDGCHAAVPVGRHQQDRQHARGRHGGGHRGCLPPGLEAGPQGHRHLPRRQQAVTAAVDRQEEGRGRRRLAGCRGSGAGGSAHWGAEAIPAPPACRARSGHAQVPGRGPRGLHHGRPVRRTASPARCSSRWPRKAAPSAASWTRSPR